MKKYFILILTIVPIIFLYKMIFFGEIVTTNDELERHPINQWQLNYSENNDDMSQWYPNLFSGMPSYGGYIFMNGDPTKTIRNLILFNPGMKVWFYLSLSVIGMFVLLRLIGVQYLSALFGSLISGLTPYSFGLINAGHLNKIFAMAYIPWVLAAIFYLMKKPTLKSILFLAIASAFHLWSNHPQIVYYTWMVIGFYWVWEIGYSLKDKAFSLKFHGKQLSGILGGLFLALLMVSDPYLDIYKFQEHSNRGAKSILDQTGQTESGTDWNYATQWSFHPKETISFIFPYHYGLQNFSTRDLKSAAYWGFMPFTQSTHYLGLVAIIFAILGALLRKPNKLEWFLWSTTFLVLITGFGSFFPILYKPFFSIFPFFSKFRIPSMIYVLLAVTIPALAALGLDSFLEKSKEKDTFKKSIYIAGGIAGFSILFLFVGESLFDFSIVKDTRYNSTIISQIQNVRIELFQKGLLLALAVSLSTVGLIWGFVQKKINKDLFFTLLIGVAILDIWIVSNEFLILKPAKNMDLKFKKSSTVDYLLQDTAHFRIFPADELNSNKYSYWNLESIGGYRPIKLRNYQDLMDAKGFSHPHILNMLNVKYVLTRKKINNPNFVPVNQKLGLYRNENVLPKAWIVGNLNSVKTQRESLMNTLLTGFDPAISAIVVDYDGESIPIKVTGTVHVKSRVENKIELTSSSVTGGLLVLSEVYYKPGWKAFVNGEETSIFQTNHILRSIRIPKGENDILFIYDDLPWKKTRILSRSSLLIILFGLGFLIWKDPKNKSIIE